MLKKHTTKSGESFDWLAVRYYSDEKLASKIIQANPDYSDVLIFEEGIELTIPEVSETEYPESLPPWRRDVL